MKMEINFVNYYSPFSKSGRIRSILHTVEKSASECNVDNDTDEASVTI